MFTFQMIYINIYKTMSDFSLFVLLCGKMEIVAKQNVILLSFDSVGFFYLKIKDLLKPVLQVVTVCSVTG